MAISHSSGSFEYARPKGWRPPSQAANGQRSSGLSSRCLVAGTWPVRSLADDYLAAAHALQLVLLALVFPPLFWLATPTWAIRGLVCTLRRAAWPPGCCAR